MWPLPFLQRTLEGASGTLVDFYLSVGICNSDGIALYISRDSAGVANVTLERTVVCIVEPYSTVFYFCNVNHDV